MIVIRKLSTRKTNNKTEYAIIHPMKIEYNMK